MAYPLYVPIDPEFRDRLAELAKRERRRPQDQAAWLLQQALSDESDSPALVTAGSADAR